MGKKITLKKVYKEVWRKKRGSAKREFQGHKTEYWVDGVPVKRKEYLEIVKDLCDEDTFKILTNPRYFNEVLHWQDRRKLLLGVCGDISDADVIASDGALKDLPAILGDRSIEDHRKVIAARRADINKEIEKIPVRIDEVTGQKVADLPPLKKVEKGLADAKATIDAAKQEKAEIETGGMDAVLTTRIREINNEISRIDNEAADGYLAIRRKQNEKVGDLSDAVRAAISKLDNAKIEHKNLLLEAKERDRLTGEIDDQLENLRARWHKEDARELEFKQSSTCPTCGQDIPEDQLEAARDKAQKAFNTAKAATLEAINKEGAEKKARREELKKERLEIAGYILEADAEINTCAVAVEAAEMALEDYKASIDGANNEAEDPERAALAGEKARIEKQIAEKKGSLSESIKAVDEKIAAAAEQVEKYDHQKFQHEGNARIETRVDELKKQERDLAAEFEKLEHELFLTDAFIRAKVHMLEERINSKFKVARFKLFDTQINEGLKECCEVLCNGVPYGSMNNAAKIQIGIDIIETLANHFGKHPTIFIDNAESVSEIPETTAQQIRLVVSPKDDELRIAA